jgi:hypothetical protein
VAEILSHGCGAERYQLPCGRVTADSPMWMDWQSAGIWSKKATRRPSAVIRSSKTSFGPAAA